MNKQIEDITQVYNQRKNLNYIYDFLGMYFYYNFYSKSEREFKYSKICKQHNLNLSNCKIMEIGAGSGDNLLFFHRLGIPWENIFANELLGDRVEVLKQNILSSNIFAGDATELKMNESFDIVLQSTVFTSILDNNFKAKLANCIFKMVKPGGIVLWYDFKFNNPQNKNVKAISKSEILELFPACKSIEFTSCTLAPPIGRRIGKLYNTINLLFPFLRSHIIAVIKKKTE